LRRVRLGLVTLLLVLLPAASAVADSIVFVRDGNVWISTPDGSTERPLTASDGFFSPSIADDGTIVALRGRSFVRLRPDGAVIGMPLDAIGGDWVVASGPYDARVSPDGLKVAYWFTGRRRFCLPPQPACSLQDSDVSAYAFANRVTDPLELGVVRERRQPSWYGAGRALVFRHGAGRGETVSVNRVGRGEADDQGWFPTTTARRSSRGSSTTAARGSRRSRAGTRSTCSASASRRPRSRRCAASCRAGRTRRRPGRRTARCSPGSRPTACMSPVRCQSCASPCPTAR
jgi:hypothetical protein